MLKTRSLLIPLIVTTMVLFQLAMPIVARADDGTPPEPTAEPVVPTDPGTDPGTTPVEPALTVPEILDQAPEGTEIVVVNADGTFEPLATQAAAQAIASADPAWCPAGQKPGDADCMTGYTSLADLLSAMNSSTPADGTIWIEGVYVDSSSTNPSLNGVSLGYLTGSDLNAWADNALTIQGGWDGNLDSTGTITSTNSTFDTGMRIFWSAPLEVNNLDISNSDSFAVLFVDNSDEVTLSNLTITDTGSGTVDSTEHALYVESDSQVDLTNVDTEGGETGGAYVNTIYGHGDVNVTNSTFIDSGGDGLIIGSEGDITLTTSTADSNDGSGTYLNNSGGYGVTEIQLVDLGGATGGTFTLTFNGATTAAIPFDADQALMYIELDGLSTIQAVGGLDEVSGLGGGSWQIVFENIGDRPQITGDGSLLVGSTGLLTSTSRQGDLTAAITINGGFFSNNGDMGAQLNSSGDIDINGSQFLQNSSGDGLHIDMGGLITLDDIVAHENGNLGAYIFNDEGGGEIFISDSLFIDNLGGGLGVVAEDNLTLIGVTAVFNEIFGANLWVDDIALIQGGAFSNNDGYGLYSSGWDDITLTNLVTVNANNGYGAWLDYENEYADIYLTASFDNNIGDGLFVTTAGDVTTGYVTASGNIGNGATFNNTSGTGFVYVGSGGDQFISNTGYGLSVLSAGTIDTLNINVSSNGTYGALLDNTAGPGAEVDIDGGSFSNNGWTGLDVYSAGNIFLTGVTAETNEGGVYLDASLGTGGITVDGTNNFNGNAYSGLTALTSAGNITLQGVTASGNFDPDSPASYAYGAGLTSLEGGLISVTDGNFMANDVMGLWIETYGTPVNLVDTMALGNGLKGAYIDYLAPCGSGGGIVVNVDGGVYQGNGAFGVYAAVGPAGDLVLLNTPSGGINGDGSTLYDFFVNKNSNPCPSPEPAKPPQKPFNIVNLPETGITPVSMDCTTYAGSILILPNGDRMILHCLVNGEASLVAPLKENLPGSLPVGRTFVSAMTLELTEAGEPLQVITEGGYVTVKFAIPEGMTAANFAILYWDPTANSGSGGYVELPPYEVRPDGIPMMHHLHPDLLPDDNMHITAGVRQTAEFVKVDVTFLGTFVLVEK